jgi:hypothetical protein
MSVSMDRPPLWSYMEIAEMFNLDKRDGYRCISVLVKIHGLTPVRGAGQSRWLDRKGIEVIAKAFGRTLPDPSSQSA